MPTTNVDNIYEVVYKSLYRTYGPQGWWPAASPLEMMVGAILVQNTAWRNVEKALANFDSMDPSSVWQLPKHVLIEMIRPAGFYNQKSQRVMTLLEWFAGYDFDVEKIKGPVEKIREQLLSIKGIGEETADCIMVYALEEPYFVIDQYTRRLFDRLGKPLPKSYGEAQAIFHASLGEDVKCFNEYHALIVKHSQTHCKRQPLCRDCPLHDLCSYGLNLKLVD